MSKPVIFLLPFLLSYGLVKSQTPANIFVTNPEANNILSGSYNPSNYAASTVINDHNDIICGIKSEISTDSLHSYLEKMSTFHNRNTGSDTVSATTGIGAARRWAYEKFNEFSSVNENRLVTSYLQFNQDICGMLQHRNIFTVLPGTDTADKSIIIIEGHIDSRCEDECDIACKAHGMEDNGSGSALVLELARVMGKYSFKHSMVFMLTIGEEQGLWGANAFAQYAQDNGIAIRAVQNNDIVGGILCGNTSSPPSCPYESHIDSTHVRVFSSGSFTLLHRSFARAVKIFYDEKYSSVADVPMEVLVMNQEDRTGRGGDHIPFRQRGYTSIRFCSANEHGDAGVTDINYTDRQHTTRDTIGTDTDFDGVIDSFFVDFNYLKRNAILNALTATMVSEGPEIPGFTYTNDTNGITVKITGQTLYPEYRIGVRPNDSLVNFEAVYSVNDTLPYIIPGIDSGQVYYISVAAVNSNGIMSMFSKESFVVNIIVSTNPAPTASFNNALSCSPVSVEDIVKNIDKNIVMRCKPNPANRSTAIIVEIPWEIGYKEESLIIVWDITGKEISKFTAPIIHKINKFTYHSETIPSGIYTCGLVIDGVIVSSDKLVIQK